MLAWYWDDGNQHKVLVAVNYSPNDNVFANIVLPDCTAKSGDNIEIRELIQGVSYQRSASEIRSKGLGVLLSAWQAQVFDYSG